MLNKLLKRCMPWMDKGRWYHVVVDTLDNINVVDHDSMLNTNVTSDNLLYIGFNTNRTLSLIDCHITTDFKTASEGVSPYIPLFIPFSVVDNQIRVDFPELIDSDCRVNIWFFMR